MLKLSYVQPPNDYPTSDGKPMAETDHHRDQMVELIQTLQHHFRDRPDVYVSGNLLWFYQQGDRRRHLSPDVLVRHGSPKGSRLNYLQWEEGGPPQVVIELTSKSTSREDLGRKYDRYQQLGVEEYYLFDPLNEYLKPRFRIFHRRGGQFIPVLGEVVYSPCLELELLVLGDKLRLRQPGPGDVLPTPEERAAREQERADEARTEAEVARSEAEVARSEAEVARSEAEVARSYAEAAREEALQQARRAQQAEEELRALKARQGLE